MRSFTTILATVSLAASAFALPANEPLVKRDDTCMSAAEAQQVADNFNHLISNYSNALANSVLTVDYDDYTASVSTLIDSGCTSPQPLDGVTFAGRDAFEAAQGSQPNIPFEQLNLWYNCDTVFLRWRTALTPEFVTGIIVLETTPNTDASTAAEYPWLIDTTYSEFNSGAWLVDLGVFVPTCSAQYQP